MTTSQGNGYGVSDLNVTLTAQSSALTPALVIDSNLSGKMTSVSSSAISRHLPISIKVTAAR